MKIVRPNNNNNSVSVPVSTQTQTQIQKKDEINILKGDLIKVENVEFTVKDAKKEENTIFIETEENITIPEKAETTIENLMNELLPKVENDEKYITFEITLTKRQKEIFDNKGGVSWLKKCIIGNIGKSKKKK